MKSQVYAWDHATAALGPPIITGYTLGDVLLWAFLAFLAGVVCACIALRK